MVRPRKWRKVCCLPENSVFGPLDRNVSQQDYIEMTVDEYETIRLMDLEGFTQEESAEQMNIARTTVQRIYNLARQKVADALVNGKALRIEGGDIEICDGLEDTCVCGGCQRHRRAGKRSG